MSRLAAALLALGAAACASSGLQISTEPPVDDPLVEIAASDPRIRVDAVYATPENFVGETLYPLPRLFLRRSAMERLSRVQDRLEGRGLGLLVFDGYRPWSVTKRMWDVIGDPDFVADPSRGSRHNRGMAVAVVGGGNTAVEEALYLTHHASSVTLIHRRDSLRAERILQERLFAHPKVNVIWNSEVAEVIGGGIPAGVTGVSGRDTTTGAITNVDVDGLFVAIGHAPATELVNDQLTLRPSGYVWTEADSTKTSIPGVFAAGDVTDDIYRQAVTAAGMGCMAALVAERFLSEQAADQAAPHAVAAE